MKIQNYFRRLSSREYLNWDEYMDLVTKRSFIFFIHNTTVESYKNLLEKLRRKSKKK